MSIGSYGSPGPHSSSCSTSRTTGAKRSASAVSSATSAPALGGATRASTANSATVAEQARRLTGRGSTRGGRIPAGARLGSSRCRLKDGHDSPHRHPSTIHTPAGVAELVDAPDSKSGARKGVWVRAPPPRVGEPGFPHEPPPPPQRRLWPHLASRPAKPASGRHGHDSPTLTPQYHPHAGPEWRNW